MKPWLPVALKAVRCPEPPADGAGRARRSADPGDNPRDLQPLWQPLGIKSPS